jgi:hypothetical protein
MNPDPSCGAKAGDFRGPHSTLKGDGHGACSVEAEINLGGFVDFVCARSTRRIAAVADVVSMYAESYAPECDFYRPMRKALLEGVINGDDLRRAREVCEWCTAKKREPLARVVLALPARSASARSEPQSS